MQRADALVSAQLGNIMRTALTILEAVIGTLVLIGSIAITMDGLATTFRLSL